MEWINFGEFNSKVCFVSLVNLRVKLCCFF